MVSAEEIVLTADVQRTDCILHSIVVDTISAVKDVATQTREKRVCVDLSPSHS